MRNLLTVSAFIFISIFNANSQNIFGAYYGSLISDNNLIFIEDIGEYCVVKIFFSEKESIQVSGKVSNGKLTFPLPQNEGEDLAVFAELDENSAHLNIGFEVDGKSYNTTFERIESPKRNLVKTWFDESNTPSFDPRIIGQWVHYRTTDSLGNVFKDDILSEKRYTKSFLENGVVLYDIQMIRDVYKEYGYNGTLDYTSIPKSTWSTSGNNRLTIVVGKDIAKYTYQVSGDSLKLTSDSVGSFLYFVKK